MRCQCWRWTGRRQYWVEFRVYTTRRGMLAAAARTRLDTQPARKHKPGYHVIGSCQQYSGPPGAVIYLSEDDLGGGIVAHEVTHAMLHYLRTCWPRGNPVAHHGTEERLATEVGELCRLFWGWWLGERGESPTR